MQGRSGRDTADGVSWAVLAGLCAAAFAVLTAVVVSGAADSLDGTVAHRFRPEEAWGEPQDRVAPWLGRLAPVRMFALLAVTCLAAAAWRRSWHSITFGVVTGLGSVAATLLVKVALARVDPLGGLSPDGGSYPSGHMVAVVVSVAASLVVLLPRVRWWCWVVLAAPSGVMAVALVVTTSHWVTDVVGGALLAGAVVATARWRWPGRRPGAPSGVPEWGAGQQDRGESTG